MSTKEQRWMKCVSFSRDFKRRSDLQTIYIHLNYRKLKSKYSWQGNSPSFPGITLVGKNMNFTKYSLWHCWSCQQSNVKKQTLTKTSTKKNESFNSIQWLQNVTSPHIINNEYECMKRLNIGVECVTGLLLKARLRHLAVTLKSSSGTFSRVNSWVKY